MFAAITRRSALVALVAKYARTQNGKTKSQEQFARECVDFRKLVQKLAEHDGKSTADVATELTEEAITKGLLVRDGLGRITVPSDPSESDIQTMRVNNELSFASL